jgi:mannitol/fructose-specific phosphotransferase system IIA component (Ntr-type)
MNLSTLLRPTTIRLNLFASSKEDLIRQAVDLFERDQVPHDRAGLAAALLERERMMSTGIGGGVAIPHAQRPGVPHLAINFIRSAASLAFDALDGRPVRLFFTIVGPEEKGGFIQVLATISRLLYTGDLQQELLAAATPEEVIEVVRREEERFPI